MIAVSATINGHYYHTLLHDNCATVTQRLHDGCMMVT